MMLLCYLTYSNYTQIPATAAHSCGLRNEMAHSWDLIQKGGMAELPLDITFCNKDKHKYCPTFTCLPTLYSVHACIK